MAVGNGFGEGLLGARTEPGFPDVVIEDSDEGSPAQEDRRHDVD